MSATLDHTSQHRDDLFSSSRKYYCLWQICSVFAGLLLLSLTGFYGVHSSASSLVFLNYRSRCEEVSWHCLPNPTVTSEDQSCRSLWVWPRDRHGWCCLWLHLPKEITLFSDHIFVTALLLGLRGSECSSISNTLRAVPHSSTKFLFLKLNWLLLPLNRKH